MDHVFRSTRHGGDRPAAVLFGQALGVPVGVCALPVMIGALVTMLEGGHVLPFLTMWFPLSLAVAWMWTALRLRSEIVELTVGAVTVTWRTRWDVAARRRARSGAAVLDVRRSVDELHVIVGHETLVLRRPEWPDVDAIESACRQAREAHLGLARERMERTPRT